MRLGLLTSLFGFAALVFSGFPGLAQLGVFSIAGLLAAAATTRYVFPVLAPDGAPGAGLRASSAARAASPRRRCRGCARWSPSLRSPALVALVVAAVAVARRARRR